MRIKFLGTGGAFNVHLGNSSVLVYTDAGNFLIDCGHSVFPQLVKTGLIQDVDYVLVTHMHDDHVGSLSSLLLFYQIVLEKGRLPILYPSEAFRDELYALLAHSLQRPEERMEFLPLSDFPQWGAIDTYGQHVLDMPTWGYYLVEDGKSLVYSGDNGDAAAFFAKLDALRLPEPLVFHEVAFFHSTAHTHYQDLYPFLDRYPIYGYHCDQAYAPADNQVKLVVNQPEWLATEVSGL